MPPDEIQNPESTEGDDQQQDTAPTFDELLKMAGGVLTSEGKFGDAMALSNLVHDPKDLDEPEDPDVAETVSSLVNAIKGTERGAKIVGDLLQAVADDKAERTRKEQEEQSQRDEQAARDAETERHANESPEDRALREADEAQQALTTQVQGEVHEVRTKYADIRKTPGGDGQYEEKVAKVEEFLAPARALADLLAKPNVNPARKVDEWDKADPITRERARQFFGIPGTFHVDVESPSYRKNVEIAITERRNLDARRRNAS